MKNNKLFKDLTILIATIPERKLFLKRVIDYYSQFSCKIVVIGPNKEFRNIIKKQNVKYVFYDKKHHTIEHLKKWLIAFSFIKTKFVINLADDDFVLPSYLIKSVKILKKNKEYSCVEAFSLRFNEMNKKINFNEYFLSHHLDLTKIIKNHNERINYFHGNLLRSVFRTNVYLGYIRTILNKMYPWPTWVDFLFHAVACLDNYKIYYLPQIGHLRSENIRSMHIKKYKHVLSKKIDIIKNSKNMRTISNLYSKKYKVSLRESENSIKVILNEINKKKNRQSKFDYFLSRLTDRFFFFKINSFFIMKKFNYFPIWNITIMKEIYQIMRHCKKAIQ